MAGLAFAAGAIVGGTGGAAERDLVRAYVHDWRQGQYSAMYAMLDDRSRKGLSLGAFTAALQNAAATVTVTSLAAAVIENQRGDVIPVRMRVQTKVFGPLRLELLVPVDTSGPDARIRYSSSLLFPGLRDGEQLSRVLTLPPRADLLAGDGTPLAAGAARSSPIPDVATQITGAVGPVPPEQRAAYVARGYPVEAKVGLTGLEHVFQDQLAGTPGGTLLAGRRVLARVAARPAAAVRTTISPPLERAAVAAIGGRYAGIAAMDPRTGALVALAGVAFSALQPPGSTMKIVTVTGALEAGIVKLSDSFPVQSSVAVDGVNLQNANGESCGGTLLQAFANSCNSVFAPLGAKLGATRLVAMAQRFGFDQPSSIPGAAEPLIPAAGSIRGDLDVGSSAIGQGMVQSTALGMTDVAATIAMRGRRPIPTLTFGAPPRFVDVTSPRVARLVQRMMIAVVEYGTGTAAQISGVQVAGKTGTAELRNTADPNNPNANSPANTDAWFVGYAPVRAPRIVVGALFPGQGAGGATAAPAVRQLLAAGLGIH